MNTSVRLFTFGCSFTMYNWPTWADLLGVEFVHFYNWGVPGLGNRAIAERVAECHATNRFTENDIVIIQWSSYIRNDFMRTDLPKDLDTSWRTKGGIFGQFNQGLYDKSWFEKFWDDKAFYIHTLNNIVLVQQLLKSTGCTWAMTSLNDLRKAGNIISSDTNMGEYYHPAIPLEFSWDLDRNLIPYKESIWDDHIEHWLPPMIEFCDQYQNLDWWFDIDPSVKMENQFNKKHSKWGEMHPTVTQHLLYCSLVKNRLGLGDRILPEQQQLANQIEEFKTKNKYYKEFIRDVESLDWATTQRIRGL